MAQVLRATRASAQRLAALAAALIVFAAPTASAQLLQNNGFETGLTGWILDGYKTTAPFLTGVVTSTKHSGAASIRLTRADVATYGPNYGTFLYQWVPSTTNTIFTLDWWVRGNGNAQSFFTAWMSDGATIWNDLSTTTGTINGWTNYTATFTGLAGTTAIGFSSENTAEAYFLDDVTLTAVVVSPEPASMALLGTGLLGVFAVARRRRQA